MCSHPPFWGWTYFEFSTVDHLMKSICKVVWFTNFLVFFYWSLSWSFFFSFDFLSGSCLTLSSLILHNFINIYFGNVFFHFDHNSNQTTYLSFSSFFLEYLCDVAIFLTFVTNGSFISLNFTDNITNANFSSFWNIPLSNYSLRHCRWQRWHLQFHDFRGKESKEIIISVSMSQHHIY